MLREDIEKKIKEKFTIGYISEPGAGEIGLLIISVDEFYRHMENALKDRSDNNASRSQLRDEFNKEERIDRINELLSRVMPNRLPPLYPALGTRYLPSEVIYNFINYSEGEKNDLDSIKFQFIKSLCELKEEDEKDGHVWVECFAKQVNDLIKSQLKKPINLILYDIFCMSRADFETKRYQAYDYAGRFGYLTKALQDGLSVGDALLEILAEDPEFFMESFLINPADAGQLKQLLEIIKYEKQDIENAAELGRSGTLNIQNQIVAFKTRMDCKPFSETFILAMKLKNQLALVTDELKKAINLEHYQTGNLHRARVCVNLCLEGGGIDKSQLIAALNTVLTDRDNQTKEGIEKNIPSAVSKFIGAETSIVVASFLAKHTPRRMARETSINDFIAKVEKNDQITTLDALREFLTTFFGEEGPHSLKYVLLCELFGFSKEVSKPIAHLVIDCFKRVINEMKGQVKEEKREGELSAEFRM